MLTDTELQQIMPRLPQAKRQLYLPFLNKVMEIYEIDTPLRAAAFLAQIAHESAELRFMEEIWGPTEQQKKYEPPSDLATRLGNTQQGDGFRYRGRGPIQITGRSNYQKYGSLIGIDLVGNPDLAATPQFAFTTAALFWKTNGLNELADVEDFITITKRINGGLNGLADRQKYYEIAKNVLGADEPGSFAFSAVAAPTLARKVAAPTVLPPPVLPRGQEMIEQSSGSVTISDAASPIDPKAVAKKKSARPSQRPAKKLVPVKKAARPASKKVSKKAAAKSTQKAATKKAAGKAGPGASRKVAKKTTQKAASRKTTGRKMTGKSAKPAAKTAAARTGAKATKAKAAKKSSTTRPRKQAPAKKTRR
jgi:predicted chitinase